MIRAIPIVLALWPAASSAGELARVVGGVPAVEGAWPDVAAITYPWGTACNGVLIAPNLVLTAGHCATSVQSVIVGTIDYEQPGETLLPLEVHEYPDSVHTVDIAIIELESPSAIPPRRLALECDLEAHLFDGASVAIVGYGATDEESDTFGTVLMQAFTTVGDADCSELSRGCRAAVSPGGELVAGGDGIDSCNGDSGGPLYLLDGEVAWLVGLTSRASQPADTPCGDGGIYVRPDAVFRWLQNVTEEAIARPDCSGNQPPWPVGASRTLGSGESIEIAVDPNDPDPGDVHEFSVANNPLGDASFTTGSLSYTAPDSFEGTDTVTVLVTDNGGLSGEVDFVFTAMPDTGGTGDSDVDSGTVVETDSGAEPQHRCGCDASSTETFATTAIALLLARKRRYQETATFAFGSLRGPHARC